VSLDALRRFAIVHSLFAPKTLAQAIERLGFVQADPIRAPARAQDLTLRQRVRGYRAGDVERRYTELSIEEDYFINYGFLPRRLAVLIHPRTARTIWDRATKKRAALLMEFITERGEVHPRDVDRHFGFGSVTNYWGGTSNASTHLLDSMHYRGLLRVARREAGVRIYAPRVLDQLEASRDAQAEALLAIAIEKYAPLPATSLRQLTSRLRRSLPQLAKELTAAEVRARAALAHEHISGIDWYWPGREMPEDVPERVRFLAPFDPVVWDRQRFELFWDWAYRFEAYTPASKRKLGYYALPLLYRDRVIGWGNLALEEGALKVDLGYVTGKAPRDKIFKRELEAELERMREFLR
jgi:uncharacterized protein YcaQ